MNESFFFEELLNKLAKERLVDLELIHDELDAILIAEILSKEQE